MLADLLRKEPSLTVLCDFTWQGSVFRLTDGKALRGPVSGRQPTQETRMEGGRVQVRSETSH